MRGIHAMLEVPAAHERVSIHIDGVPLRTVQVGTMEVYDRNDPARAQTMAYCTARVGMSPLDVAALVVRNATAADGAPASKAAADVFGELLTRAQ